ncbi:DUF883 family protein [Massilia sp. W12]|uniref:DUF883 family protein n=1 Tax=Massilia sp. W12 TaxID=3126507 RepID=UPI0030D01C1B
MGDLKVVIRDAEELLRNTGAQTGENFRAAKEKFENSLSNAKHRLQDMEDAVVARGKAAARATDQYVTEHPWQSVGLAAAVGLIAGLLIARK